MTTEFVYAACSLACALVGAGCDLRLRRIPNLLTLPAIAGGLLLHFLLGGWPQAGLAAGAGLACGLIFLLFHLAGGMGGGDVKLMAAAGSIAGLSLLGPLLLWTSLAGGVMAIAVALYHRRLNQTWRNLRMLLAYHGAEGLTPHPELNLDNAQALRLPYGVAIAGGSALTLYMLVQRG